MFWPEAEEISYKDISIYSSVSNFGRGHHEKHFCKIILIQEEMLFNDISCLELRRPMWNRLCSFGRGHYDEHFSEVILNSGEWFRRRSCWLTDISYLEHWQPLRWIKACCAIMLEGFMRNNSMKLFRFGPVVQEKMSNLKIFLI